MSVVTARAAVGVEVKAAVDSDRMHSRAPSRPLAMVTPQGLHVHTLHGAPVQTHTGRDLLAERPPTH